MLRRHAHGQTFPHIEPNVVLPANGTGGRFELFPSDVADELQQALGSPRTQAQDATRFLLHERRLLGVMNTVGRNIPGTLKNP